MQVLFVETRSQARAAAERKVVVGQARVTVVALTPEAGYELERCGTSPLYADDLVQPRAVEALGEENFERLERLCTVGDELLGKLLGERDRDFQFHRASVFQLKTLFDAFTFRIREIEAVITALDPVEVHYFRDDVPDLPANMLYTRESIYARVVPIVAARRGRRVVPHPALLQGGRGLSRSPGSWLHARLRSIPSLRRLRLWWTILRGGPALALRGGPTPLVLFLGRAYGAYHLMQCGLAAGYSSAIWEPWMDGDPLEPRRLWKRDRVRSVSAELVFVGQRAWDAICGSNVIRRLWSQDGYDLFQLAAQKLEHHYLRAFPAALGTYRAARAFLAEPHRVAVVAPYVADPGTAAVAQAAHAAAVPMVIVQHGEYGLRPMRIQRYLDFDVADYTLTYGDGVRDFVTRAGRRTRAVSVGSIELDALRGRLADPGARSRILAGFDLPVGATVVLYALTNLDGNQRYLSWRQFSDVAYFRIQRRVVDLLAEFPTVHILLKLHPNPDCPVSAIVEYVRDRGYPRFHVQGQGAFADLLPAASAVVLDFPSSTLVQAALTNLPIFLYYDYAPLDAEAVAAFKDAIHFFAGWNQFATALRRFLAAPHDWPKAAGTEFRRLYATHLDDGRSVERTTAFLAALGPQVATAREVNTAGAGAART